MRRREGNLNIGKTRKHLTWLGGTLVLLAVTGSFGVSVMNSSKAPIEESAETPKRTAYAIPGVQDSKPVGARRSTAGKASTHTSLKSIRTEQPRARIMANSGRHSERKREQPDNLAMPEWEKIILPGGMLRDDVNEKGMFGSNGIADFVDLYNGVEAEFIQETLSNGVATDMSALLIGANLSDEVLFNGAVRAEHDLGNAYLLATIGTDEHLRLYAGVERLITDAGTFIEIEFNQNKVNLGGGAPWQINGNRIEGDVLVRMIFSNRMLQSVQLEQWQQDGYNFIDTSAGISGNGCLEMNMFMYCVGPPPIRHPEEGFETWDDEDNPVVPVLADDFVEVGIDVDLLLGPQAKFTSVLFRTPEDIAMNNFRIFEPVSLSGGPLGTVARPMGYPNSGQDDRL
jgi:hypothetical protein